LFRQVGHLAMAQYGLCLFRIRGRQSEDAELMSSAFRKKYFKGTTPDAHPSIAAAPKGEAYLETEAPRGPELRVIPSRLDHLSWNRCTMVSRKSMVQ
jgi:hypothetical protein